MIRSVGLVLVAALAACRPSATAAPSRDPHARARARLGQLGDAVTPKLATLHRDGDVGDRAWVARQLVAMAEVEQQVRAAMAWSTEAGVDRYEAEYFDMAVTAYAQQIDARNAATLRRFMAVHGWFPVSSWGAAVEGAAWLVAQHADNDPWLQREVLARIEPLVATRDTDPSRFALLFDRVARADGRAQRYGTQGACTGGAWVADETEAPAQLDERRAQVGLPPMRVYVEELRGMCR